MILQSSRVFAWTSLLQADVTLLGGCVPIERLSRVESDGGRPLLPFVSTVTSR